MVQTVNRRKKKKKGRPSKADLADRNAVSEVSVDGAPNRNHPRRCLRRRNVQYMFDFDDFVEDEEFEAGDGDGERLKEDDEDEGRREKKLKLLMKLHSKEGDADCRSTRFSRHTTAVSVSSFEYGGEDRPVKKRKIGGGFEDHNDDNDNGDEIDEDEVQGF